MDNLSIAKLRLKKAFNHSRHQEIKFRDMQLMSEVNSFMDKHSTHSKYVFNVKEKIDNQNKSKAKNISEYVDMRLKGI